MMWMADAVMRTQPPTSEVFEQFLCCFFATCDSDKHILQYACCYHKIANRESKKQDTKHLAITSLNINRFSKIISVADSAVNLQQNHV